MTKKLLFLLKLQEIANVMYNLRDIVAFSKISRYRKLGLLVL